MTLFALFSTPVGACAIVWSESGIGGLQLPERSEAATRARLRRRFPEAEDSTPSPEIENAIAAIRSLLSGEPHDLSSIALDMEGVSDFERRVYEVARSILPGETLTYGEIAKRLGEPGAARAVGAALGANPFPIVVPCHRVLGADGKVGGFSAHGGIETKLRMLTIEKARTSRAPSLFDELPLAAKPRR